MTARSTRNKMKWQAEMIMRDLVKVQRHLKLIDDLAEGNSEYIEKHLPNITTLVEYMAKIVKTFREGL